MNHAARSPQVAVFRTSDQHVRLGIVEGEMLHEPGDDDLPELVRAICSPGVTAQDPGHTHALGSVDLLAPVAPGKIICVGLNYRDHAEETGLDIPERPLLFAKFPSAVTGPRAPILVLPETTQLDYEAELGIVIGRPGRDITERDALEHVLGAVAANDVSARDAQFADGQWVRGKSLDSFAPFGPWLTVTGDEPDLGELGVRSWVNGELRQESNTRHLIFDVPRLISYISRYFTLNTGDLILTGTPGGVGMGFDPPKYLSIGDVVEVEVDGLGRLSNTVVAASGPGALAGSSVASSPGRG
ncbi:fumarylacetoacetate hydrolase family protein [Nocardioides sp.]|uniref:fumarylacetoacetate hydrolase family protein n=1 Tax=Nocardioides sp. TaxID=35761 RepID=UPI003782E56E